MLRVLEQARVSSDTRGSNLKVPLPEIQRAQMHLISPSVSDLWVPAGSEADIIHSNTGMRRE